MRTSSTEFLSFFYLPGNINFLFSGYYVLLTEFSLLPAVANRFLDVALLAFAILNVPSVLLVGVFKNGVCCYYNYGELKTSELFRIKLPPGLFLS